MILFMALWFASLFGKVKCDTMRTLMTRRIRMILSAIAIEMVIASIKAVLTGLAGPYLANTAHLPIFSSRKSMKTRTLGDRMLALG